MEVWPFGYKNVLYSFLHNYKLRKTIGLLYLLLYGSIVKNCSNDFGELSVQFLFDDVSATATRIDGLIENIFVGMPEVIGYFFKNLLNNEFIGSNIYF